MSLAIELEPRFVFFTEIQPARVGAAEAKQQQRQWCSSKARVLRIATTYTHCKSAPRTAFTDKGVIRHQRQAQIAINASLVQVQHERNLQQMKR